MPQKRAAESRKSAVKVPAAKPVHAAKGGAIKKFSKIARPQRFQGVF